jgi:hypothetical protein
MHKLWPPKVKGVIAKANHHQLSHNLVFKQCLPYWAYLNSEGPPIFVCILHTTFVPWQIWNELHYFQIYIENFKIN